MIKFSASNNSFYDTELQYSDIPVDAVDITQDAWGLIMQARSAGQIITHDNNGYPKALPPQPDSYYVFDDQSQTWIIDTDLESAFLSTLKASKKSELTTARDTRIDGFDVITIGKGSFNIDRVGLNKLSNRLIAKQRANDNEVITSYVTTDLVLTDLTKSDVIDILDCQDDIESQISAYYVDLIDQVNKAQTIEAVELINWSDQVKQR